MATRKAVTDELLKLGFSIYSIEQAYQMHAWVNGDLTRNVQKMTDIILQSQHLWNSKSTHISLQKSNRKRKLSQSNDNIFASNCNPFEPETKRIKLSHPNQEDIFYDDMIHLFNEGKISYSHSKKEVRKKLAEKYGLNEKELKRNKAFNAAIERIIDTLRENLETDRKEAIIINKATEKPTKEQSLRELKAELNSRSGGCPMHGLGHHIIFKQKALYLNMYCNLCEDILIQQIELPLKLRDNNNGENNDDANANKIDQEKQSEKIMKEVKKSKDLNEWNCHEIIHWMNRVDDGKLNDIKYQCLKKQIKIGNIKGFELSNINDTALKLIGIKDVKDRKLILNYIFDLISNNNNNNNNNNNVDAMSIDICGDVPDSYLCPISYEIMRDPVLITISAHTYERQVIEKYVKENKMDPITLQKVEMKDIISNRALKESIEIWRSKNTNNDS